MSIISNCHDCIVSEGNETHNRAHISSASIIFGMGSKGNKTEWTLKHTNRQIAYSKKSNKHKEPEMKVMAQELDATNNAFGHLAEAVQGYGDT